MGSLGKSGQVWASLGKSEQVWTSLGIQESPGNSGHTGKSGQVRAYRKVRASPGIQESTGKSGHTVKSGQVRAYRKVLVNLSNIGQAWVNLNDSDDENDDDDKTMIETGKSDASLAYLALFVFISKNYF